MIDESTDLGLSDEEITIAKQEAFEQLEDLAAMAKEEFRKRLEEQFPLVMDYLRKHPTSMD